MPHTSVRVAAGWRVLNAPCLWKNLWKSLWKVTTCAHRCAPQVCAQVPRAGKPTDGPATGPGPRPSRTFRLAKGKEPVAGTAPLIVLYALLSLKSRRGRLFSSLSRPKSSPLGSAPTLRYGAPPRGEDFARARAVRPHSANTIRRIPPGRWPGGEGRPRKRSVDRSRVAAGAQAVSSGLSSPW